MSLFDGFVKARATTLYNEGLIEFRVGYDSIGRVLTTHRKKSESDLVPH